MSSKPRQVTFKKTESKDEFQDSNPQDAEKIDIEKGKSESNLPKQQTNKQLDRNIGGIMKPEKGRSMWDLTAEEDEDEEDPVNIYLEAIKVIAIGVARKALANQFVLWFQQSAWDEVREVLFASVEGYVTSLDSDLQLSDEELRELLEVKDGDGDNLLQVALYKGAPTDILIHLIEVGGKEVVEAQNNSQQTSLHYACRYDAKFEVIEKLLDQVDNDFISKKDEDEMNALHYACSFLANFDIVKLILEKGGNGLISEVDKNGFTSLHFACRAGADENVVQLLLDEGPVDLVFQQTYQNWSALHHACANNASVNVVKMLVNKGGIKLIEMKNNEKESCLYHTCETSNDPSVLISLLDTLGQEKIQSNEVVNALFIACARGAPAQMIRPFFKGDGVGNLSHRRANNQSILHVACSTKEVKLDTVQALIKFGGKRLINYQDGSGENVLHYCVKAGVSDEIVEALIDAAGDYTGNFIRCRDHHKCNALHCIRSVTPLEVIDRLVQGQNALLCFQKDGDKDLPLDNMIHRNSEYPEKQITHIQEFMYDKDKTGITIQHATLQSIRDLPSEQQAIALRGKYVRSALNHHTIKPLTLYFMMLDIILQLMTIWIFSFEMKRNMDMTTGQKIIVAVCFAWLLIRAFDFVDALQLILLGLTIISMIFDFSEDFSLYLLILCIGVSWLRFVFVFSNVIYRVKVFVSALESITKRLLPFVFVTVFIVMAFAHMFHAVGPPQEIQCPSGTLEEIQINDYNAGGWICNLNDSYFQSFAMLLSGDFLFFDKPMGLWSALALIFALVIGIILLNILIAVVNDSFVKVEENSDDVFWLGRLKFVYKVQKISRYLNLAPEDEENIINILKILTEHDSLKSKPSRRMFSHWDTRDIDEWRDYPECYNLLYWFENGSMPEDKSDKQIQMLTLKQRLLSFSKVAELNEIIPPSTGMVQVIAGAHRREKLKGVKKWAAVLFCWIIFAVLVLASPIILIFGLLSGGKSLPHEFKAFLFGPIDAKKHFETNQKEIQKEIDDLRDEVKKNQAEILALLQ
ncbi:hypothetical protein CTEN210_09101 [Chaetoceros tenuissimus]|uniref:Ion transport domain-containing protein n=1 Tax=Chaetoceros tenuissimus TaxID=426638 RepID=A0AAD3H6W6_9STRA|nr:hypothetical protein CTEN210_09101 [Chaetoceros tenuissimus]